MKKLIILSLLVLISLRIYAQSEETFAIKINPLSVFLSTGSMFFEGKLNSNASMQMGVAYTGLELGDFKYEGIILTPEVRFYAKQRSISGFYIAPYFRYQNFNITVDDDVSKSEMNYKSFGGGLLFGRQWVYSSGFVFDLFAGPSYNNGDITYKSGDRRDDDFAFGLKGTGIRVGIAIGFGF